MRTRLPLTPYPTRWLGGCWDGAASNSIKAIFANIATPGGLTWYCARALYRAKKIPSRSSVTWLLSPMPTGIVAVTTMSAGSLLAELCRRVIKPILAASFDDQEQLLGELTSFFKPDLLSLPGMSRRHEDWVLDNILHPWPARITFTIPEAIDSLDSDFDFLGTSPSFVQDWRWYKSIPHHSKTWNDVARDEYRRWGLYLIDYRLQPAGAITMVTGELEPACEEALRIHHEIWHTNSTNQIPRFAACLSEIQDMISAPAPETARAIRDYLMGLEELVQGDRGADFGTFRTWFGRGQQYVSFSRR